MLEDFSVVAVLSFLVYNRVQTLALISSYYACSFLDATLQLHNLGIWKWVFQNLILQLEDVGLFLFFGLATFLLFLCMIFLFVFYENQGFLLGSSIFLPSEAVKQICYICFVCSLITFHVYHSWTIHLWIDAYLYCQKQRTLLVTNQQLYLHDISLFNSLPFSPLIFCFLRQLRVAIIGFIL